MRKFRASLIALALVATTLAGYAQTAPAPEKLSPQQAQILADTQKLRKLSQELKAEVDKSSKETLSLTVIKKAQEVEKLARSLKEEMSKGH